ncbi:NAD(P)-binding protein [Ceraceosorus guamensis]|uniref:NAD(P)-binding protein n=1 Tax=Ceraceosorus guamensis TaxID=1522189 RepID=A0A316VWM9_9BASI|nr:NAD(P)-binding protein [Ceraceosorus guamensis]PWN41849.1 NAD(P)-binding protein [Ceraceosorus guamensis]
MAGDLVLITGITGFLSAHVLDAALTAPQQYRVRGTLRSASKKEALLARLTPAQRERVQLVEVKDTATCDLTEALKDVKYVAHVASPYQLNVEDAERDLLKPAIEGTLNLLRYAAKSSTVERVAVTSSFAAVTDFSKGGPNRPGYTYTAEDWNPSTFDDAVKMGGAGAFSYSVSKKLAEQALYDFVQKEKPNFTAAAFNPPMIYGATLQPGVNASNLNTSSKTVYGLISGAEAMPENRLPLFCNAQDVAQAHVAYFAIPSPPKTRRYLLSGPEPYTWELAVGQIAEDHPELKSRLPKGWESVAITDPSQLEGKYATLDTSLAQKELGIEFKNWSTTLKETLTSLLSLEESSDWKA